MNYTIIGGGALGSFIGARLIGAGKAVSFVTGEDRRSEIIRQGLNVDSSNGRQRTFVHTQLSRDLKNLQAVLLTTRSHMDSLALASVRNAIGPDSVLVPFNSNLKSLETMRDDKFADVCPAVAMVTLRQRNDGSVKQLGMHASLLLGALQPTPHLQTLKDDLSCAGFEVRQPTQIEDGVWCRFTHQAAAAALQFINGSTNINTIVGRRCLANLITEARQVGARLGHTETITESAWWLDQLQRPEHARTHMLTFETTNARMEALHNVMVMVRHARDVKFVAQTFERAYEARRVVSMKTATLLPTNNLH
jgi:ketopantoate reductase